nr:ATP-dependent RNA helicase HrpA [Corynebacterium gerontici]
MDQAPYADLPRFRARLRKARSPHAFEAIAKDLKTSCEVVRARESQIGHFTFPEQLPVSAFHDELFDAIAANQVVIIAGETGSGKTTQIPKICLELGRGRRGLIGHTQPRRLAARTVAERIAEELDQEIGQTVGYAIRFDDRVSESTAIKLMTDGILLAEMQRDRMLRAYDTIIIDEAHERSLNIDFLLGYLKQLLPQRPELKVIITSATIDPERFARHFSDASGNPAPVIEVSGRTYPVEVLYRPLEVQQGEKIYDVDPLDGLIAALKELMSYGDGDILCFFAGESDIREAMEMIEKQRWKGVEVTPLFGRLSNQEQHRVFKPHAGRRIVLATNIAETSLTVPGIHYVVDTGYARISRYSTRTKVQRLPIEPISQASANQRSGRCGRVADGVAIRLYSEQDFLSRPEFTDPEILRTNLAQVILRMASLKLGEIQNFPFLQAPDTKSIRDGLLLLHELDALEQHDAQQPVLTPIGHQLARIPLDPRMARMLIEAEKLGVLMEAYVVVAALTIQDIRERPLEFQAQADQKHARFNNKRSDFLTMLNLWRYVRSQRSQLSGNAFKKLLQSEYLHYMRTREWFDLVRQLRNIGDQLGWRDVSDLAAKTDEDSLHISLLAGLLSHIGVRDGESREYRGSRNTRFAIFPGSAVAKAKPEFLMAAEMVETSRLWARDVAAINPQWVEKLGHNLLKHQYSEPFWSSKRAQPMVHQRSTLYGVPIIEDRIIGYAQVDKSAARDMFIREALLAGNWNTHHKFFEQNQQRLMEAEELEQKARRRDIVVDEETLFAFYDAKLPERITSGRQFDHWWKKYRSKDPTFLDFDPRNLVAEHAAEITEDAFPDIWRQGSLDFSLSYQFEPGQPRDGVTVEIPVPMLASVNEEGFDWLVPGLRAELVQSYIRTLPKASRRSVVPAPEFAAKALPLLHPYEGPLATQLAQALRKIGGSGINAEDFQPSKLPDHLKISYAAVDRRGKIIDWDKNLSALQQRQRQKVQSSMSKAAQRSESPAVKAWTMDSLGELEDEVLTNVEGQQVVGYPTLVRTADGLQKKVVPTKAQAETQLFATTLTMLSQDLPQASKGAVNGLPLRQRVAVEKYPHGGVQGLLRDARIAAIRDLMVSHGGPQRNPDAYKALKENIRPELPGAIRKSVVVMAPAIAAYLDTLATLEQWEGPAIDDIQRQMKQMLPEHAVTKLGAARLRHIPRFCKAIELRLEDLVLAGERDAQRQAVVNGLEARLAKVIQKRGDKRPIPAKTLYELQWQLQELRVSLFAQRLGTAQTVSERKIQKAIENLR